MKTYKANVRVPSLNSRTMIKVVAQINAQNPFTAKAMLEAQYGRGNVIGVVVLAA